MNKSQITIQIFQINLHATESDLKITLMHKTISDTRVESPPSHIYCRSALARRVTAATRWWRAAGASASTTTTAAATRAATTSGKRSEGLESLN